MEIMPVPARDSRRFLAAMLEGVEAQGDGCSRCLGIGDTENAAFLAKAVAILASVERVRRKHVPKGPLPILRPVDARWERI
jgi:hypothetical protein